ncbi:hypothetical protein MLD38_000197 [Melastoma candidum]|uniref:Uncharacterized protein n=1 Tax=Melastoma candidum TaxID=119954 RepID=A0ACB9S9F1_9MYRT|nr:hypothetical protein MLD38_000197 [Melastoma candidum]
MTREKGDVLQLIKEAWRWNQNQGVGGSRLKHPWAKGKKHRGWSLVAVGRGSNDEMSREVGLGGFHKTAALKPRRRSSKEGTGKLDLRSGELSPWCAQATGCYHQSFCC